MLPSNHIEHCWQCQVSVVVDDLPAAIAFCTTLCMAREGEMPVEGRWVDRLCGLEGVQVDINCLKPRPEPKKFPETKSSRRLVEFRSRRSSL